ncbi:MAG TPA: glycine oxidase ThiO [Solirubrobacterales bacterium]|nr:glycine oxidase ThiO [Solirubrobacterales bacterium]
MNSIESEQTEQNFDAVIVGAGMIGLAIAWELHSLGSSVLVVDRGRPGAGTTSVAAGMLAPVGELDFGEPALLEINMLSAGMYPEFIASVERACGGTLGYRRMGGLHVALDRDEAAELRRVHDLQLASGLRAEWLGPGAARDLEPGLTPSLTGAVLVEDDGTVDPRVLVTGLLEALEREGVVVRSGVKVTGIQQKRGRVEGVELEGRERIAARTVIAAVGAESGRAEWLPSDVRPPVRPVKGQIVELRGDPADHVCDRILASERVYLVPRRDGRLIIGATVEELGFDDRVTAGGIHELLREAYRLLPEVAELEFVDAVAGLRPGTPDNLPVVGPTRIEGLLLATGHYRNGILLAPITARAIADLADGGTLSGPITAASPARFDKAKTKAGASR